MPSHWGDKYVFHDVTEAGLGTIFNAGALYVYSGEVSSGRGHDQVTITAGQGAEIVGAALIVIRPRTRVLIVEEQGRVPEEVVGLVPRDLAIHHKPWGYEVEVMTNARRIQLKRLHIREGQRTSEQYHEMKDEVMVYMDGVGKHVVPMEVHRVEGPADYFEASTYHPEDVVRTADDYGR